jgi:hypothetical protein
MRVANKKVIVRTLADAVHAGYLPLSGFCESSEGEPCISLLGLDGRITTMQLAGIRYIAFVRDFNLADSSDPERLARRTFPGRPRSEGLWLRLTLANGGGMLEGLAPLEYAKALRAACGRDGGADSCRRHHSVEGEDSPARTSFRGSGVALPGALKKPVDPFCRRASATIAACNCSS